MPRTIRWHSEAERGMLIYRMLSCCSIYMHRMGNLYTEVEAREPGRGSLREYREDARSYADMVNRKGIVKRR